MVEGVTLITYVGEPETLLVASDDPRADKERLARALRLKEAHSVDSSDNVDIGVILTETLGVTVL